MAKTKNLTVAVTGGSGSLGRFTINELVDHGYEVRNLDRAAAQDSVCPFFQLDMADLGQVVNALHGCDAVIHLAAIPSPSGFPSQYVYVNNTVANYNVLEAVAMLGIKKLCMASSVNAIGLNFSIKPVYDYFLIDENHISRAEDCYSISKWCGEQQANGFAHRYPDMTLVSLRYHWIIRPGVYAQWRTQPPADPHGPFKNLWGYVDIRDCARANRLAIEATWSGHQACFLTAKDTRFDIPSKELAEKFYPDVEICGDLSGYNSFFNCTKANELLGWEHQHAWRTSD